MVSVPQRRVGANALAAIVALGLIAAPGGEAQMSAARAATASAKAPRFGSVPASWRLSGTLVAADVGDFQDDCRYHRFNLFVVPLVGRPRHLRALPDTGFSSLSPSGQTLILSPDIVVDTASGRQVRGPFDLRSAQNDAWAPDNHRAALSVGRGLYVLGATHQQHESREGDRKLTRCRRPGSDSGRESHRVATAGT